MEEKMEHDDANPEWTSADFRRARPTADVVGADVAAALTRKSAPTVRQAMVSQSSLMVLKRLAA